LDTAKVVYSVVADMGPAAVEAIHQHYCQLFLLPVRMRDPDFQNLWRNAP
jgi:hypothetical protein